MIDLSLIPPNCIRTQCKLHEGMSRTSGPQLTVDYYKMPVCSWERSQLIPKSGTTNFTREAGNTSACDRSRGSNAPQKCSVNMTADSNMPVIVSKSNSGEMEEQKCHQTNTKYSPKCVLTTGEPFCSETNVAPQKRLYGGDAWHVERGAGIRVNQSNRGDMIVFFFLPSWTLPIRLGVQYIASKTHQRMTAQHQREIVAGQSIMVGFLTTGIIHS